LLIVLGDSENFVIFSLRTLKKSNTIQITLSQSQFAGHNHEEVLNILDIDFRLVYFKFRSGKDYPRPG